AETSGKEERVRAFVPNRQTKVQAPERLRPSNRFATQKELIAHFNETRDRTVEYARSTADPLHAHAFPHPILRQLDCYHWLILLAAHTERHLNQLLEAISQCDGKTEPVHG